MEPKKERRCPKCGAVQGPPWDQPETIEVGRKDCDNCGAHLLCLDDKVVLEMKRRDPERHQLG